MNARIYSILLSLYPAELRKDFGAEMVQVFLEDLEDSARTRGFFGAARVWRRSLKELLAIALPAFATQREIAVALMMYVLQEIYLGGIMVMAARHTSDVPKSIGPGIIFVMLYGLIPAFTAFVALHIGNRSVPVPLNLSSK
jgi:hypothetical protein